LNSDYLIYLIYLIFHHDKVLDLFRFYFVKPISMFIYTNRQPLVLEVFNEIYETPKNLTAAIFLLTYFIAPYKYLH